VRSKEKTLPIAGRASEITRHLVSRTGNYHRRLVKNLLQAGDFTNVSFVSADYDILIDNDLTE
jgi:hypothetical protein